MPVLDAEQGIHGKLIQFKDRQYLLRDGTVISPNRKFAVIGRGKSRSALGSWNPYR
jgi:hypothetical protein